MEDYEAYRILRNLRKKKIVRLIWITTVSAAVAVFIFVLSQYIKSTKSGSEDKAYSMAQEYVKALLKNPETAVFPDAGDINIIYQDSLWWVHGFVDAINETGKLDRSQILVKLKFHNETGEWEKTNIVITNPSIFKDQNEIIKRLNN